MCTHLGTCTCKMIVHYLLSACRPYQSLPLKHGTARLHPSSSTRSSLCCRLHPSDPSHLIHPSSTHHLQLQYRPGTHRLLTLIFSRLLIGSYNGQPASATYACTRLSLPPPSLPSSLPQRRRTRHRLEMYVCEHTQANGSRHLAGMRASGQRTANRSDNGPIAHRAHALDRANLAGGEGSCTQHDANSRKSWANRGVRTERGHPLGWVVCEERVRRCDAEHALLHVPS